MCANWNQLFLDPTNVIRKPDPLVEEFIRVVPSGAPVFDLGCGAGRHLVLMVKAGLRVRGGDPSMVGLQSSRRWLQSERLHANLFRLEMTRLSFKNTTFEGAVSINVLNHGTIADSRQAIREINRILKPGSPFFFVIIGREDARYGEGEQIEPHTFIHRQGTEAGVPHHYYDYGEIESILEGFSRIELEERKRPYDDEDPVFGHDPRLQGRDNLTLQHWAVRAWK